MSYLRNVSVRLTMEEWHLLDKMREALQHEDGGRSVSLGETARRAILAEAKRQERRTKR